MTRHLALIVDDEPDICELLELTLNRMDIDTLSAGDLKTAYKVLNENNISICLTDMRLPDGNGIELVKKIQEQFNHIPVAMISAHGNMDTAIEALKAGAFDFVSKPLELAELRNLVNSAIKLADKNKQQSSHFNLTETSMPAEGNKAQQLLLGNSPIMEETRKLIEKLAKSQAPVYIRGESGTGKELAAKQIHSFSSRSDKPFVPVNCGAISSELMESEFFGHKKGSFTGADKDTKGLFQAANGGTLFLDEVADLPLHMQVKLLRAIQEKSIRPVGAHKEEKIDVRLISATHKNLKEMVDKGIFREDLYYRINVIELCMPSLKERIGDVQLLISYFLSKSSSNSTQYTITQDAIDKLNQYHFPGNVRELENILERSQALCDHNTISASDITLPEQDNFNHQEIASPVLTDSPPLTDLPPLDDKQKILVALKETRWNRKAAAKLLGMTYRQFRYRLKKFELEE